MKKTNYKTSTYDMGRGWRMDIVIFGKTYEAWVYKKDMCVKNFMFGMEEKYAQSEEYFTELAVANFDEHKKFYQMDYCN